MAIVDERGRLFGRWNLLDLAVLIVLVGLIPLAYGAYALFRDHPPTVVSISPSRAPEAPEVMVTIKGTNLRPYMRVSAGTHQARGFDFKSTEEAELPFNGLPPGTYDIVVFDSAQERFRLPQALTITPSGLPATQVVAIGAFGNLDAAGAAALTAGTELTGAGKVLAVGTAAPDLTQVFSGSALIGVRVPNALRVPAIVQFNCFVKTQAGTPYCVLGDTTVSPPALLMLSTPSGKVPFQIARVRGPEPVESVPVSFRATGPATVIAKVKAGDVDTGGTFNDLATQARVESVGAMRSLGNNTAEVEVKLIAQVQRAEHAWLYESRVLRAGGPLTLRTASYEVSGVVVDLPSADSKPRP